MLQLTDVHTYYGESHALWGVDLNVEARKVVAILGRNGMGKTTIVHSIIGFTPPRQGKIVFKGQEITNLEPNRIAQMGVALVPQGRRIFPSLSVRENLIMAARGDKKADGWNLDRVHELFPRLNERATNRGNQLSGGEQQMLCVGRALMTNPDLVLMDEPSEGLAPLVVQELGQTIKKLNQSGLSILLVEQNLSLALSVADYVYIVNKGTVVYQSTPAELEKNQELKDLYLGVSH